MANLLEKYDTNMKGVSSSDDTFKYYNPLANDEFLIYGLPFRGKDDFNRLNEEQMKVVSEAVAWLAHHPSGGQIRFVTNSSRIQVKVKNAGHYFMPHMAPTGQQGVDLYYKGSWNADYTFYSSSKFEGPASEFTSTVFEADTKEEREFTINLPLYMGLASLEIGIEKDCYLKKGVPFKNNGKVVVYGTSITQGGCTTRPGMSFTSILSRKLDVEFVNLGFSGSGMGEPIMATIMAEVPDPRLFVLDYEGNGGCTSSLRDHMEELIETLESKHPNVPILILTKIPFSIDRLCKKSLMNRRLNYNFQYDLVEKRRKNGDKNVYFFDGSSAFGDEDIFEMTVDGIHATDLGFYEMAKHLLPEIAKLTKIDISISKEKQEKINKEKEIIRRIYTKNEY